jgi:hypothetical protein
VSSFSTVFVGFVVIGAAVLHFAIMALFVSECGCPLGDTALCFVLSLQVMNSTLPTGYPESSDTTSMLA